MHDCQKFREDWIAGSAEAFGDCEDCRSFCEEARLVLEVTSGTSRPESQLSEEYWDGFENRLYARLVEENTAQRHRLYWKWSVFAGAAAAIAAVATWGGMQVMRPVEEASMAPEIEFVDDHIEGLNPTVVIFLGQSELFLRDFTKIEPSYKEELQDAQVRAREGLTEIAQQKERAADFRPVRTTLDEYENVLREIKNLESDDDLEDLQTRIRRNGLIANLKAYQPQAVLVGRR